MRLPTSEHSRRGSIGMMALSKCEGRLKARKATEVPGGVRMPIACRSLFDEERDEDRCNTMAQISALVGGHL
jgi:hypothetical protein